MNKYWIFYHVFFWMKNHWWTKNEKKNFSAQRYLCIGGVLGNRYVTNRQTKNKLTNKPESMSLPVRRCLVEDMGKSSRSQAELARSRQPGKSVCENNNNKNNNNSNNNDDNNNNNNLYPVPFFFKIICIIILGFSIVLFV